MTDHRRKLLRILRIACTAFAGLLCVSLFVLWVRSYWSIDKLYVQLSGWYRHVCSRSGKLTIVTTVSKGQPNVWALSRKPVAGDIFGPPEEQLWPSPRPPQYSKFGVAAYLSKDLKIVAIPHWAPFLILAATAIFPWVPWSKRFSLRTLFISATLIAFLLGLIVWLTGPSQLRPSGNSGWHALKGRREFAWQSTTPFAKPQGVPPVSACEFPDTVS